MKNEREIVGSLSGTVVFSLLLLVSACMIVVQVLLIETCGNTFVADLMPISDGTHVPML